MTTSKTAKRKFILETAFRFFTEKGYIETRIIDIAEACGMGKGTFYEYFDSKESLFEEVFKMHVGDVYNALPELLSERPMTCKEQLETFVHFEFNTALKFGIHKNFIDHLITQITVIQNKGLQIAMQQFLALRFALVLDILKKGIENGEVKNVDPMLAASVFLGALSLYSSFHYGLLADDSNLQDLWDAYSSGGPKAFAAAASAKTPACGIVPNVSKRQSFPPPMETFFDLLLTGLLA